MVTMLASIQPGETFELIVDEPGVIEVFCTLHGTADGQGMAGVLLVGEAAPGPVAPELDLTAVRQAVVEENQSLMETVERQTTTIGNLSGAVAGLRDGLEEIESAEAAPEPVTIQPVEAETADPVSGCRSSAGWRSGWQPQHWWWRPFQDGAVKRSGPADQNRARSATA